MINKFIKFLESQVNKAIYVWGAEGQQATSALIDKSKNTSRNKRRAKALLKKRIKAGIKKILAFDCSGLGVFWLLANGLISRDTTANGLKNKCTKISKSELAPGCMAFKTEDGHASHVGYCSDYDKSIVEARSSKHGVVKRHVDKGDWDWYGKPKFLEKYMDNESEDDMIQKGENGTIVEIWQSDLIQTGHELPKWGVDGDFGDETKAATNAFKKDNGMVQDGKVDGMTWAVMTNVLAAGKIGRAHV